MTWQQRLVWIAAPVYCTLVVLYILHPQSLSGRAGWWLCLVLGISFGLYCWRQTLRSRFSHMSKVLDNVPALGTGFAMGGVTDLPDFVPIEDVGEPSAAEGAPKATPLGTDQNAGGKS